MSWYSVVVTIRRGSVTRELKIDNTRELKTLKPFLFDALQDNMVDLAQSKLILHTVENYHEMSSVSYQYNTGAGIIITRKYHESD